MEMLVLIRAFETFSSNEFHLGFALFLLVVFAVFIFAWENYLSRSLDRLIDRVSKSSGNNPQWIRTRSILRKYSW